MYSPLSTLDFYELFLTRPLSIIILKCAVSEKTDEIPISTVYLKTLDREAKVIATDAPLILNINYTISMLLCQTEKMITTDALLTRNKF